MVAAGNFNSLPGVQGQQRDSQRFLQSMRDELGLVSAYHHLSGEFPGAETRASYYHQWNESAPFHLDYCFVPEEWVDRLRTRDTMRESDYCWGTRPSVINDFCVVLTVTANFRLLICTAGQGGILKHSTQLPGAPRTALSANEVQNNVQSIASMAC